MDTKALHPGACPGAIARKLAPGVLALPAALAFGCGTGPGAAAPSPQASAPPAVASAPIAAVTPPAPRTDRQVADAMQTLTVAPSTHNLLKNAGFDGGRSLPWTAAFTSPAAGGGHVEAGAYCIDVTNAGSKPWDAQVRHREMIVEKGHTYAVRFKIASTVPTSINARIAMSGPPYKGYWQMGIDLGPEPKVVTSEFTMREADDATAEFAFHVGGSAKAKDAPFGVCIDDIVLEDPSFTPKEEIPPAPIPKILVNQVAYLPNLQKTAIVRSEATSPLEWHLSDRAGHPLATGTTIVRGADATSGDSVHWLDFSSFAQPGAGYTLHVGADSSHPFDITAKAYRQLKYDALNYFYQTRSGIPIVMPYAGDAKWTRPAGHPGDASVPCAPASPCDYALDVSGGWYDAGDHGKYVVNGGIAVWTLLNQYERAKVLGTSGGDFADGKMSIPENHNGAPDLLDEARWELDFMMKMQVPEGHPMAGMVHHKVHDQEWTGLATRPDQDPVKRFLHPVSTAATLNVAATAAQCARLWKGIDDPFAQRCLAAAERAWSAAVAHPAIFASATDAVGGGPYDDTDVSDEFYWAASELYVTTKKDAYKDFVLKSPYSKTLTPNGAEPTLMTWQRTAALGTISLAIAPNGLSAADKAATRAALVNAADAFAAMVRNTGYRVPFAPSPPQYPWGSNSFILNNALVMALAFDFTKDRKYVDAVEEAMAYILGRNPNDQSYVTGYGFRPLQNPHHRFWAHQVNATFPSPPPGVLSGGPNSGLQDPYVQAFGLRGCAAMKCFADNIEAWSANEEAINWNAPLAWVAAFLDERASKNRL